MSVIERRHVVCSACHVACGLIVDVVDGRPGKIHGNKDNPVYHGYSCIKGRQLAAYAASPERLLQSMHRQPGGGYAAIDSARAAREIALQLRQIIDAHGPRAVAIYVGTHGYNNFPSHAYAEAILQAIGSPMLFNAVSIDQPGKAIAFALHGPWLAGTPGMDTWESLLLIGTNPIVTMNGGLGANPARWLHAARQRGLKLVVVDPRKTEVAAQADVHLAIRPGEDAAVLAGIARIIIAENLFDQDFVQANTTGFAALRDAVHGFTPEYVAARADISAESLMQAPHGNVTEYFVKVLTSLKGFWRRAGEPIGNPGVMVNRMPPLAASPGPLPVKGYGHKMRIRGLEESPAGLPTATLAEEMLMPGEGQVKALLVLGGNPAAAWPDQQKTVAALQSLDLLVSFDPVMSATARLAHYVIAPKIGLERPVATMHNEFFGNFGPGWGYEVPYAQFSPACVTPPDGSDLVEEWQILHAIAQHLDLNLRLRDWSYPDPAEGRAAGTDIDMDRVPDTDEIWTALTRGARPCVRSAETDRAAAARRLERPAGYRQSGSARRTGRNVGRRRPGAPRGVSVPADQPALARRGEFLLARRTADRRPGCPQWRLHEPCRSGRGRLHRWRYRRYLLAGRADYRHSARRSVRPFWLHFHEPCLGRQSRRARGTRAEWRQYRPSGVAGPGIRPLHRYSAHERHSGPAGA